MERGGKKFSFMPESQALFLLEKRQFNTSLSKLAYEEVEVVYIFFVKKYFHFFASCDLAVGLKNTRRTFS